MRTAIVVGGWLEQVLNLEAKSSEKRKDPEQRGRAQDAEMSVAEPRGLVKGRWSKERVSLSRWPSCCSWERGRGWHDVTESDRCLAPGRARGQGKLKKEKEEEGYHRV